MAILLQPYLHTRYMDICMHICMYICMCICMYAYMYIYCICMNVCARKVEILLQPYLHTRYVDVCMHVYVCIYVCMYICMNLCARKVEILLKLLSTCKVHLCMYVCMHIDIYAYYNSEKWIFLLQPYLCTRYIDIFMHTYACIYVRIPINDRNMTLSLRFVHIRWYIDLCMYLYMHACIHT